jgi:hypothetical protein
LATLSNCPRVGSCADSMPLIGLSKTTAISYGSFCEPGYSSFA